MSATASTRASATTPVKRGRPRRADADGAILGATLELLNEVGVAGLSMDVLAQRAGVGKATIYRRWDSKEALILDALRMTATPIPVPDEGILRDDLFTYMDAGHRVLLARPRRLRRAPAPDRGQLLRRAACGRRSTTTRSVRQATIRLLLQRGIDRGEIARRRRQSTSLVDVILAPFFYHHLCTARAVDQDFTHRLVEFALR